MDEHMRKKFGFSIEDATNSPRVLTWVSGGCRPAQDTEIALWDAYAALSQPAAAEPATNEEVELALFHINGDYGNKLKLSALRTGRALDAFAAGRAKATP